MLARVALLIMITTFRVRLESLDHFLGPGMIWWRQREVFYFGTYEPMLHIHEHKKTQICGYASLKNSWIQMHCGYIDKVNVCCVCKELE